MAAAGIVTLRGLKFQKLELYYKANEEDIPLAFSVDTLRSVDFLQPFGTIATTDLEEFQVPKDRLAVFRYTLLVYFALKGHYNGPSTNSVLTIRGTFNMFRKGLEIFKTSRYQAGLPQVPDLESDQATIAIANNPDDSQPADDVGLAQASGPDEAPEIDHYQVSDDQDHSEASSPVSVQSTLSARRKRAISQLAGPAADPNSKKQRVSLSTPTSSVPSQTPRSASSHASVSSPSGSLFEGMTPERKAQILKFFEHEDMLSPAGANAAAYKKKADGITKTYRQVLDDAHDELQDKLTEAVTREDVPHDARSAAVTFKDKVIGITKRYKDSLQKACDDFEKGQADARKGLDELFKNDGYEMHCDLTRYKQKKKGGA
ncbi:hypothetical protein N0V90_003796 [Kalmusia sp. IMI 367209]|nr:hypothetical protein N0V90_003796 [Kalmusia sp. IMI 367209]